MNLSLVVVVNAAVELDVKVDDWVVFNKYGVRVGDWMLVVGAEVGASVVVVVDTELLDDTELLVP